MLRRTLGSVFAARGLQRTFGQGPLHSTGRRVVLDSVFKADEPGPKDFLQNAWKSLFKTQKKKGGSGGPGPEFKPIHFLGLFGLAAAAIAVYYLEPIRETFGLYPRLSYQEFTKLLSTQSVSRITVVKISKQSLEVQYRALVTEVSGKNYIMPIGNVDHFIYSVESQLNGNVGNLHIEYRRRPPLLEMLNSVSKFAYYVLGVGWFGIFLVSRLKSGKQGGMLGQGLDLYGTNAFMKSKAIKVDSNIKYRFSDVAGNEQAKVEIQEFVDFLKNPQKYKELGAKIPKGALLSGPPGTGKTLLAKATAGEAEVNFLYTSGSEFIETYVGVGASRVRDLFKSAKENAPSIIFIDEIDAIGKKRDEGNMGGNEERNITLNQILVEMDGFGSDSGVVVFAATNRKEMLDPALIRTGRFDRSIECNLPSIEERAAIFKVHLKPLKLSSEKTMEEFAKRLASLTPGYSGSDIANICNEAAIQAARHNRNVVTTIDFEMAVERVIGGVERKKSVNPEERKTVAVHESGHGVVSWFLQGGMPLLKLTIIPRSKGALGFAQYLPNESSLETKEELEDTICSILGGRCAEQVFFGKVTTGAYDDLEKVYNIAHNYVTKLGMSDKIGYLSLSESQYGSKKYSNETSKIVDQEIKALIDKCTERTMKLVQDKKVLIQTLSDALLEKETLDLNDIVRILGPRPFEAKSSFKDFLEEMQKNTAAAN